MTPEQVLKQYFGHDSFRGSQRPLIMRLLAGQDVLGVMPTGAGKSICYQLPALMRPGLALVISPLISLMHDQVARLTASGLPAACLTSAQSYEERCAILSRAARGQIKLLYVAPERLHSPKFRLFCQKMPLALVAVDEAHCVSQWGQDFRPSYLDIAPFLDSLPVRPPVCAFTATATRTVRNDIAQLLGLHSPFEIVSGFDRPNLYFAVQPTENKPFALLTALRERQGRSGIVYCLTRRQVDDVFGLLRERGISAARYHAGLDAEERQRSQEDFLYDRRRVLVATNAFGMGVDKPNVSFVIHYQMPTDLESYYQEAGRAGRDGEPADCLLLCSAQDVSLCRFLLENSGTEALAPETAARQRQADLTRLRRMEQYTQGETCLRAALLRYFGQSAPDYCGACSVCGTNWQWTDATLDAQKIVSCVYRLQQRGRAVGKQFLIELLRGQMTERVQAGGLSDLSTFGILADSTVYHVRYVLDSLIAQGYLTCRSDDRPVVQLNSRSDEIIRQRRPFAVRTPKAAAPRPVPVPHHAGISSQTLEALDRVCSRLAARAGVPAFSIFPPRTLREIARRRPQSVEALARIPGVSAYKAGRYGPDIIACLRETDHNTD